jgi:hypothetical protein
VSLRLARKLANLSSNRVISSFEELVNVDWKARSLSLVELVNGSDERREAMNMSAKQTIGIPQHLQTYYVAKQPLRHKSKRATVGAVRY